jgi:hypothetical protein
MKEEGRNTETCKERFFYLCLTLFISFCSSHSVLFSSSSSSSDLTFTYLDKEKREEDEKKQWEQEE